jgi:Fe-S cluster biogenesis protein NfuA
MNTSSIEKRVLDVLESIRPYLISDGGDLELIEITPEMVARVELKGTCTNCSMNNMTFKAGVEDAILKAVPEITKVEAVNFELY